MVGSKGECVGVVGVQGWVGRWWLGSKGRWVVGVQGVLGSSGWVGRGSKVG